MSTWIYIDADNSLWDSDALFAQAQPALLGGTEELSGLRSPANGHLEFVKAFNQAIVPRHHQRLRDPPTLLARTLSAGRLDVSIAFGRRSRRSSFRASGIN